MYAKIRLKTGRVFWATAKSLEGSTLILRVVNKTGDWGVTKGNKIIDEYAVAARCDIASMRPAVMNRTYAELETIKP